MRCKATPEWQLFTTPGFSTDGNTQINFEISDHYTTAGTVYIDDAFMGNQCSALPLFRKRGGVMDELLPDCLLVRGVWALNHRATLFELRTGFQHSFARELGSRDGRLTGGALFNVVF